MNFLPVACSHEAMPHYVDLFKTCFPAASIFHTDYLTWLYRDNPDGTAIGFDAWEGNRLAAHYVCIPAQADIDGQTVRVMLSLNTATHPDHQGKGLFTQLAEKTYQAAAEQGIDAVYGVANANSTPGFLRKLGFQKVRPLEARIGWGKLGLDHRRVAETAQFRRRWTTASLDWRCNNPNNRIQVNRRSTHLEIGAPALLGKLLPAYAELPLAHLQGELHTSADVLLSPLRLFIGLIPAGSPALQRYLTIPDRLRPSPLNLIYRSLSGRTAQLNPEQVFFSFLDFDPY